MNNHTFYKSFSGADAVAFMVFPGCSPILLGSVTTISYSMYRDKKPVSLIGHINVSGYTRGMRVIAGSLVFTMLNQHITKDIKEQIPYIKAHNKVKADELPMFDIMIVCANEYGKASRMMIYGIDITDDSQVVSIQDLIIENTFNFVARDVDEFTSYKNSKEDNHRSNYSEIDTFMGQSRHGFDMIYDEFNSNVISQDLFDLVQDKLYQAGRITSRTGVFDNETFDAIKVVQREFNLPITGALDESTYKAIFNSEKTSDEELYIVTNLNGAILYSDKELSQKTYFIPYMERIFCKINKSYAITTINGYELYLKIDDITSCLEFDFKVSPITECTTVTLNFSDFTNIGLNVLTPCDIKVTCISEYPNGKRKVISRIYKEMISGDLCTLKDISEAYIYDIENQSYPHKIIYISKVDDNFYKWVVNVIA